MRPEVSADGLWVIYADAEAGKQRIWKVSIDGGEPVQLTDYASTYPTVSPDGRQLAIVFVDEQSTPKRWRQTIIPIEGGMPGRVFDFYNPYGQMVRWTMDGRALTYIETKAGISNLWSQPVDGGTPKLLTNFKAEQIFNYAFSRDGKLLAMARGREMSDVVLINSLK